jgi:ParB-like chromosome segregation protein Spo0J
MTSPVHSARRPDMEAWLDELGAKWAFEPDLPIARIDMASSLANQVRHDPLNDEVVDRYAADMRRGNRFPPLLVEVDHLAAPSTPVILGGNHRLAAALAAGLITHPAYLVVAPESTLMRIRFEDNARHGLPPTMTERIGHAVELMRTGLSQAEAAAAVGVPQPKLSIAVAVLEASDRADDLGVDGFNRLSESVKYSLSQVTDPVVFSAVAEGTVKAALPSHVVKSLVRTANAVEPTEALRIIGAELADHDDRATDRAGNVRRSSRTARARFDAALAEIRGLSAQEIFDSCPSDDVRAVLAQRTLDAAKPMAEFVQLVTGKA